VNLKIIVEKIEQSLSIQCHIHFNRMAKLSVFVEYCDGDVGTERTRD